MRDSDRTQIGGSVIHPRLVALGAPSEVRGPLGIVNGSWDRLLAFCMRDLLFCVLCRCRTFFRYTSVQSPSHSCVYKEWPVRGFTSAGRSASLHRLR